MPDAALNLYAFVASSCSRYMPWHCLHVAWALPSAADIHRASCPGNVIVGVALYPFGGSAVRDRASSGCR